MAQRLLVTGGLGFIGSEFIRRTISSGAEVLNVDLDTYAGDERRLGLLADRFETRRVDVADPGLETIVSSFAPQVLIHFAAESHVTRSEQAGDLFHRTNVGGTSNVLEAAVRAEVPLVVHISTDEVYGPCPGEPYREEDKEEGPGRATSPYAQSKALADDLALSFSDRLPVIVVRPTNCFGPWQHPEKAVARWTTRALLGERLPVWGDGRQVRDWMHVEDACSGIETIVAGGAAGEVYNLAPEGRQRSNYEIALAIAAAAGRDEDAVYLTAYDRPDHDRRYAVDASKVRSLGWKPQADLEDRITETVSWYRANASWWRAHLEEAERLYEDESERKAMT